MSENRLNREQLLSFAREIMERTGLGDQEFKRIARLVKNCEMSLSGFLNAIPIHYMNIYLTREDLINYLLVNGYTIDDEIFSVDFPQKWLVDEEGEKVRPAEYWEFDENVSYIFEHDPEYIKELYKKINRFKPGSKS
jgi:hypothetical protein